MNPTDDHAKSTDPADAQPETHHYGHVWFVGDFRYPDIEMCYCGDTREKPQVRTRYGGDLWGDDDPSNPQRSG